MKRLLCYFTVGFILLSCKTKPIVDYAIISGKIENNNSKEITIANMNGVFQKTIGLEEDGTFIDTLKIIEPGRFIIDSQFEIYLDSGYNLHLEYNAKDHFKTGSFSGIGADFNQYILNAKNKGVELQGSDFKAFYALEKDAFKGKAEKMKSAKKEILTTTTNIPEILRAQEERNIDYEYLLLLEQYKDVHLEISGHDEQIDFSSEFNDLKYGNESDYQYSPMYRMLVGNYYRNMVFEMKKKDSTNSNQVFFEVVRNIENKKIRNSILYNRAQFEITYAKNPENYFEQFMEISTNDFHRKSVAESYDKLKKIVVGQPSPEFVNYENYAGGTTSMKDLNGSYLYIDVWATWCKPCVAEIPALKDLEKEYEGKNIEFVSISIDREKDYESWKQMVTDEELGGVQLIADKAWESDFVQDYQIKGIPRFILIDPEGKIIDAKAPRPSSKGLAEVFGKLNL